MKAEAAMQISPGERDSGKWMKKTMPGGNKRKREAGL